MYSNGEAGVYALVILSSFLFFAPAELDIADCQFSGFLRGTCNISTGCWWPGQL